LDRSDYFQGCISLPDTVFFLTDWGGLRGSNSRLGLIVTYRYNRNASFCIQVGQKELWQDPCLNVSMSFWFFRWLGLSSKIVWTFIEMYFRCRCKTHIMTDITPEIHSGQRKSDSQSPALEHSSQVKRFLPVWDCCSRINNGTVQGLNLSMMS
jgi:hypothetical protein